MEGPEKWRRPDEELVVIRSYSYAWEANVERGVLEEEGIPTFLEDDETVSMNWLYSNAVGGVKLQVPESRAEEAVEILSETREHARSRVEDMSDEGPPCPNCGSTNSRCEQKGRRWFYLTLLFLGFPIYWPPLRYRCKDCGETWEKEKDED
ncbi:MAG: DUF2007 domain-containing protein [Planctomycetota bacterium]